MVAVVVDEVSDAHDVRCYGGNLDNSVVSLHCSDACP